MSPLLWYLPFMIMTGAYESIYRTDQVRTDHMDEDDRCDPPHHAFGVDVRDLQQDLLGHASSATLSAAPAPRG